MKQYTSKQAQEAKRLWRDGYSLKEIAAATGINPKSVWGVINHERAARAARESLRRRRRRERGEAEAKSEGRDEGGR